MFVTHVANVLQVILVHWNEPYQMLAPCDYHGYLGRDVYLMTYINDVFQVILVHWNEPYQKLATCDSLGVINVWTKHANRWSVQLINDRSSVVSRIIYKLNTLVNLTLHVLIPEH